jgi:hypothetical protein
LTSFKFVFQFSNRVKLHALYRLGPPVSRCRCPTLWPWLTNQSLRPSPVRPAARRGHAASPPRAATGPLLPLLRCRTVPRRTRGPLSSPFPPSTLRPTPDPLLCLAASTSKGPIAASHPPFLFFPPRSPPPTGKRTASRPRRRPSHRGPHRRVSDRYHRRPPHGETLPIWPPFSILEPPSPPSSSPVAPRARRSRRRPSLR